jgi:predicted GIY-YIG superfamily endonuclease
MTDQAHALYRFFDADGVLLYIGITADVPARFKKHRDQKPWWNDVARIAIEQFPDRESVLAAEKRAIKAEQPRWNIQHQVKVRAKQPTAPSSDLLAYCEQCFQLIPQPDGGVIHVEIASVHEHRVAYRAWKERTAGKPFLTGGDLLDMPDEAKWHVHCNGCNPHYDEDLEVWCSRCYWFNVGDCSTWATLVTRTAHLAEKDWLSSTDWMQFIGRVGHGRTLTGLISREQDMALARGEH